MKGRADGVLERAESLTPRHSGANLTVTNHSPMGDAKMPRRQEFETIVNGPDFTPDELTEALDSWARADGGRTVRAVVHLLLASGLAQSWPQFGQHLSIELYTDTTDPDPQPYPIARVLDWNSLHNAIPADVGKSAFSLFVYARCLGDRGFTICVSDLIEGMEPSTQRIVHAANALRFGLPAEPPRRRGAGD